MKHLKNLFLKLTKSGKGFLLLVNIVGIIFITFENLYYSYGMMLYKTSFADATEEFWSTELLFGGLFLLVVNGLALIAVIREKHKKNK